MCCFFTPQSTTMDAVDGVQSPLPSPVEETLEVQDLSQHDHSNELWRPFFDQQMMEADIPDVLQSRIADGCRTTDYGSTIRSDCLLFDHEV